MQYYEYQQRHKEYIVTLNTALLEQDITLDYQQYINDIKLQWNKQPDYLFYQEGIVLNKSSSISKPYIPSIIREDNYSFIGIKKVKDILYYDNEGFISSGSSISDYLYINDLLILNDGDDIDKEMEEIGEILVWEFMKEGRDDKRENRKYLYIELNISLLDYVKVPTICHWNINKVDIYRVFPNKEYLLGLESNHWKSWYSLIVEDMTHPFLNGFIFTGRVIEQGEEGILGYEYRDNKGFYGIRNAIYISPLKPIQLDFPLGIPDKGQVDILKCNERLIDLYPSAGYIPYDIGKFTGYTTNSKYHSSKVFYIYERKDGSVFASEYIPHPHALNLLNINYQLCNGIASGLTLDTVPSKEEIYIYDKDCSSLILNLKDYICNPDEINEVTLEDIFSDCVYIDDDFYINKDNIMFNDINIIDDYFLIGGYNCSYQKDILYYFDDSSIINDTFLLHK